MQQLDALKALKDLSHGGRSRRPVELIGDGLRCFGQFDGAFASLAFGYIQVLEYYRQLITRLVV